MPASHAIERFLATLAAAVCLMITIWIWRSVGASQETWPLPGLYFIELMALGAVCAGAFLLESASRTPIAWATTGVFMAFAVLGAWTVGLVYVPIAFMFLAVAVVSDLREMGNMTAHAGILLAAGLAQAAGMLIIAWLA
jgi:hypothetical protein